VKFRNYIIFILNLLQPAESTAPATRIEAESILSDISTFSTKGYTQEADSLARKITNQLFTIDRTLNPGEVNAHLGTELYYAFNTQWGTGRTRNHRIAYDFLSKLDNSVSRSTAQKETLTAVAALSFAAQEYFWNDKSTLNDLKSRVKREFRYGLFKKSGHKLNISNLVFLDEENIDRIVSEQISEDLREKLKTLMLGFKAKTLGQTYAEIADNLTAKLAAGGITRLLVNLPPAIREIFSLPENIDFKSAPSAGDGMCGENSLFIQTDGAVSGISESNARYKIERAILDQAIDQEARRLYLLASPNSSSSEKFLEVVEAYLSSAAEPHESEIRAAIEAYKEKEAQLDLRRRTSTNQQIRALITNTKEALTTILEQFRDELAKEENLHLWTGNGVDAYKDQISRDFNNIIEELLALESLRINPELEALISPIREGISRDTNAPREQRKLAFAKINKLVGATLRPFIDANILPGKESTKAFNIDKLCEEGNERYSFLTGLCAPICRLLSPTSAIAVSTETIIENGVTNIREEKESTILEIEHTLTMERIAILGRFTTLPPVFSPDTLRDEMHKIALKPGELSGWLPCDAIYVQLWAIINNLNIFVFSSGEAHGRSKLDLITRLADQPYTQETTTYPENTTGKHLATVILTSPTSKNMFLSKSSGHYDKFIALGDYAAIASATRHMAWNADPLNPSYGLGRKKS